MYIYQTVLSLIYVDVSSFLSKEISSYQNRKRQGNHTLPALVLFKEEREWQTSIAPQRLVMQPDRHSRTSCFATHRAMRL